MKNLLNLKETPFTNNEVMKLIKLYQFNGKDFYYEKVFKGDIDSIMKRTVEKEALQFARYFKLDLTDNRKNLLVKKDAKPKTNTEKLLSNFKAVFTKIHDNSDNFELISNDVLLMLKTLYNGVEDIKFNYTIERVQRNLITENQRVFTREKLEETLSKYESLSYSGNYEVTYIITNFFIDLNNLEVFNKGDEIARLLLLYISLCKAGFGVFRYVSFFELLNLHRDEFNGRIQESNFNYEAGFSNSSSLQKLIIDMLLEGYNQIETAARAYEIQNVVNKTDNIESTILTINKQVFTKDDIRERHPHVSESTINRTLKRLRDQDIIRPNGVGRSATWVKLIDTDNFDNKYKQMDMFQLMIENPDENKA